MTQISSSYHEAWFYSWDGVRKEIKDSILDYEYRYLSITSGVGGNGRSTRNEVKKRHWIMKHATESELQKLTEYPWGNIKAIAYEGLLRKKAVDQKYQLVLDAINDRKYPVYYQSGCEGSVMEIGTYLIYYVLGIDDDLPLPPPREILRFGLTESDRQIILAEYHKRSIEMRY